MTVSTDAILFFGWLLDEDSEIPWRIEDDGSVEEWHRGVLGYEPPFELFTKDGEYIDGKKPPEERILAYFAAQRAWDQEHPLPVEEVAHCSDSATMYAIAVTGTSVTASRGYPEAIDPTKLIADPSAIEAARGFCKKHNVPIEGDPKWWLASWWG